MKPQKTLDRQNNVEKDEQRWKPGSSCLCSRQYDTSIYIDTQTNGTEQSLEIQPCTYSQVIFDKGTKNTQ